MWNKPKYIENIRLREWPTCFVSNCDFAFVLNRVKVWSRSKGLEVIIAQPVRTSFSTFKPLISATVFKWFYISLCSVSDNSYNALDNGDGNSQCNNSNRRVRDGDPYNQTRITGSVLASTGWYDVHEELDDTYICQWFQLLFLQIEEIYI